MSFSGSNFMFDDQYSENYGVFIRSIGNNGVENSDAGSNIGVLSGAINRKPTRYFYGTNYENVLSFDMTIMSESPIYGMCRTKIEKWLFQKMKYCKLFIIQQDLQNVYFNCFLLNPEAIYVGNICYGYTFSVECDSPWAWQVGKTYNIRNINNDYIVKTKHYNDSDNNDFTYPYLEFKMNDLGGDLSITNAHFPNEPTVFTNLPSNEIVKVDNEHHIITCSSIDYISERFNKKFFKLLSSNNTLTIMGNFEYVKFKYRNARKVGG